MDRHQLEVSGNIEDLYLNSGICYICKIPLLTVDGFSLNSLSCDTEEYKKAGVIVIDFNFDICKKCNTTHTMEELRAVLSKTVAGYHAVREVLNNDRSNN